MSIQSCCGRRIGAGLRPPQQDCIKMRPSPNYIILNNSGREMIYSCSWPDYIRFAGITVNYTDIAEHCNIWRMYNDVQDDWGSVLNIIDWVGDNQETLINAAGPGHFNDPDSLMIGNFALSYTQAESQMALYSIMAAPLLMGNDLRNLDPMHP